MKLLQLPPAELRRQLAGSGVWLRTGPFSLKVQSRIPSVAEGLSRLYGQFEVRNPLEAFAHFHVSVNPPATMWRWLHPQATFTFNGEQPFKPFPREQAFAMLESGLDWCVSTQTQQFLLIQAAAVEKNGLAAILPGPPGSGKSTLAAGLVLSGWRLLSDEFTLLDRHTGLIHPLPRPVGLKNQSIDVIRQFAPDACFNRTVLDTLTGTQAHMRPPRESVRCQYETARPGWVIFPKWEAGATTRLTTRSPTQDFEQLALTAFINPRLGEKDICMGSSLINRSDHYDFRYSRLNEAVAAFDRLADSTRPV